jgi:hypothetical protein
MSRSIWGMKTKKFGLHMRWRITAMYLLALFCAPFVSVSPAFAQEEVVSTPPELRDFKLEADKPAQPLPPSNEPPSNTQPAPRTTPQTQSTAPSSASNAPNPTPVLIMPDFVREGTPRTVAPAVPRSNNVPQSATRNAAATAQQTDTGNTTDVAPELDASEAASETTSAAEMSAPEAATPSSDTSDSELSSGLMSAWPLWQILVGSLIALLSIARIFWLFRRKQPEASADDWMTAEDPEIESDPIFEPALTTAAEPSFTVSVSKIETPLPTPVFSPPIIKTAAPPPISTPLLAPILEASFTPLRATISLANLTIKGGLKISNIGKIQAQAMSLRTQIISASEDQEQHIAGFHADRNSPGDQLGDAVAGENIDLEVDLSIPLHELKTYALKERKLFVPIVLINLEYGSEANRQQLQLSCMIGREATPPTPKMGPLRLDLGPRSFAPLGQRPLFG